MANIDTLQSEFLRAHKAGNKAKAQRLAFVLKRALNAQGFTPEVRAQMARDTEALNRKTEAAVTESANPALAKLATTLQGVPFVGEGTDEGIGKAVGWLGGDADAATEKVRLSREGLADRAPGQALGLQLAGGVGAAVPMALAAAPYVAAAAPSGAMGQVAAGGLGGLTGGAIEGASSGYLAGTDPASRAEEAGNRAAFGGAMGLGLGAAAPVVGRAIGAGVGKASQYVQDRMATAAGMSPNASRVIDTYLRDTNIPDAIASARKAGGEAMLADSGYSARKLTDAAMQQGGVGGSARNAIESRAARSSQKLTDALDQHLGKPGVSTSTDLVPYGETRSPLRLLYERAYSQPIDYASDAGMKIERLVKDHVPASAIEKANRMIRADPDYAGVPQIMAKIADDGKVTFEELPNVTQLDLITRALNDVAEAGDGAGKMGGMTNEGRIYGNLARRIRDQMKIAVPDYKAALDAAGTEIGKLKARDLGQELLSSKVWMSDAQDALRGMPQAEVNKVKEGMRAYIDEMMARTQRAMTDPNMDAREAAAGLKMLSSRAAKEKMRLVLGDETANRLQGLIDEAATGVDLRASLAANSQTFARQEASRVVQDMTKGGPVDAALRMEPVEAVKGVGQVFTGKTADAEMQAQQKIWRDVLNELVATRGASGVEDALNAIAAMRNRQLIDNSTAEMLARDLVSSAAASGYQSEMRLQAPQGPR